MPTRIEIAAELKQWRKELFVAFQATHDASKKAKLEAAAAEIDDLLDNLALMALAGLKATLDRLRRKVEALTRRAAAGPFGSVASDPEAGDDATDGEEELPPLGGSEIPGTALSGVNVTAPDPGIGNPSGDGMRLTEAHLIGLWRRSLFPIDGRGIIVFGIRGCLPVDYAGTGFAREHEIGLRAVNYRTMNCTIGQWRPSDGFALFPGSTVPFGASVTAGRPINGLGVNQLGRGRYNDYRPGWHKRSEGPNGHWALLQECPITLQRTGDDDDFDELDRWEVGRIAGDNIHCAFHMGASAEIPNVSYSSVGCQAVAGTVKKGLSGSERGPWAKFIAPFQDGPSTQRSAEYVLFDGAEVQQMIKNQCRGKSVILRMGSRGDLVKELQRCLASRLGRTIDIDGDFGTSTFQAAIDFQTQFFGANSDDGIVGPETAKELGFELPLFDFDDAIAGGSGLSGRPAGEPQPGIAALAGPVDEAAGIAWGAFAEKKCGPGFKQKVIEMSTRLQCDPSHLMAVMAFETGGKFAPDVKNAAGSGAVGLIQFMRSTAQGLGTTTQKLEKMTALEQLPFVEKHFRSVVGNRKMSTLSDVYMAVLYPVAVGRLESFELFKWPSKEYQQNRGLDINGGGTVTKAEASARVAEYLVKGMEAGNLG